MAGGFQILFSIYWAYRNLSILYDYRVHSEILRLYMISDWILILQTIIGLFGIVIGFSVFSKRWGIKNGYITFGLIWLIGFGIEFIQISF